MTDIIEKAAEEVATDAGLLWSILPQGPDIVTGHGFPEGCRDYWERVIKVAVRSLRDNTDSPRVCDELTRMLGEGE